MRNKISFFTKTLRACHKRGRLTIGDLKWFFGRDFHTVREWLVNGRQPTGARNEEAADQLLKLNGLIRLKKLLPAPLTLTKRNRAEYMRLLGGGYFVRAHLLAAHTAPGRAVRGIRKKGRAPDAASLSDNRKTASVADSPRRTRLGSLSRVRELP